MGTALPFNLGTLAWRAVCVFGVGVGNKTCASEEGGCSSRVGRSREDVSKENNKNSPSCGGGGSRRGGRTIPLRQAPPPALCPPAARAAPSPAARAAS